MSMLLEHMVDLRPSDPRGLLILQAVRSARSKGWWGTTLDTVAATSALIKWMGTQSASDFTGVITTGEEQITFTDETPCRFTRENQSNQVNVNLQGANLKGAKLMHASGPYPGEQRGSNLENANLKNDILWYTNHNFR